MGSASATRKPAAPPEGAVADDPRVSLRVVWRNGARVGPGKIALLENIAAQGSISAAGRALGMSYRRAWELVAEMNATLGDPVVQASAGGQKGGGTTLTAAGEMLVLRYRSLERDAAEMAVRRFKEGQGFALDPLGPAAPDPQP